ncbi:tail fiber assembly protein [Photorhabdus akhurstii]|uniref:tail fiber assembly protein n=1 Tax=Photorhabdus akhurstii TaxID=171438 RepID=UPI0037049E30
MNWNRGAVVYDTKTGKVIIIERLGSLPSEVTSQPPTSDFDVWNGQSREKFLQCERVALISQAENLKKTLLVDATSTIAQLQDSVDLGMATGTEKSSITERHKYRVLLNRVDCTTEPDIQWLEQPK